MAKIFEELHDKLRSTPHEIEWQGLSQSIETSSTIIQSKFVNTVAAFGVEVVLFPFVILLIIRSGHGLSPTLL